MKEITISDHSESNKARKQQSKQRLKDKPLSVATAEDKDNEDQEDNYMPYIGQKTVDGYLVSIIANLEKST
jgi:hypothetical protein